MTTARILQGLALAAFLAAPSFADPGELFPSVPSYDEAIVSPVSHPERTLQKPRVILPPVATPTPVPTPAPTPTPTPTPTTTVAKIPTPTTKDVVPIAPPPIASASEKLSWTIDRSAVLTPFLTAEEQAVFEKEYVPLVRNALKATPEERRKISDDLSGAADKEGISPGLRRYLMLQAVGLMVRAQGTWNDRRIKAERVVPLLEDKTVAIGQARVDCLNNLCQTVNDAPPKLLEYMVDSHMSLARYQIQAGFGAAALDNMATARKLIFQLRELTVERSDNLAETQAYVDRGATALAAWPRWQTALKTNPKDPGANTFVATAHLSIYHDVERAATYAAKSEKKEFLALAKAVQDAKLPELPSNPNRVPDTTLALCSALCDLAKQLAVPYDRFSIGTLVNEKLTALTDAHKTLPAAQLAKVTALRVAAKDLIDRSGVYPVRSAVKEPKPDPAAAAKAVKTFSAVAGLFEGAPKKLFPEAGGTWTPDKIAELSKWLRENCTGQILAIKANLQRVGAAVDKADGTRYTPASFAVNRIEVKDTIMSVNIDAKFFGRSSTVVRMLPLGQEAAVSGYITSIQLRGIASPTLSLTIADTPPAAATTEP